MLTQPDPFATLLGYHLRRASVAVMADLTASLAPLNLKPTEASILFLIAAAQTITQAEIGRTLGIQRANMAPLIARLITDGLVTRRAADGRSQSLHLTPAGLTLHNRAKAITQSHEHRLFSHMSSPDQHRLIAHLTAIWQATTEPVRPGVVLS